MDSPYTPSTAPRSVHALAPRPVGGILSHAAGQYEIGKVTVVQPLSVLRRAGVIHEGRREVATPVWAAGVASGGRWSPFLGPSTQYGERPVLKCPAGDFTHNLLALPKFSSIVYISVPDVHDLGKESDDVSRFVGIRSAEVGSPAGLGADEHHTTKGGSPPGSRVCATTAGTATAITSPARTWSAMNATASGLSASLILTIRGPHAPSEARNGAVASVLMHN